MMNTEQELPADNQWDLLVEYGHWFKFGFHALWVEGDDQEELARLLKVDPGSRLECDLETLAGMNGGGSEKGVWMGPHAPGWTHIFVSGMYSFHPAIRNLGKRRVFEIYFAAEVGEGLEPLYLNYDGEQLGDVTPPDGEGGAMDLTDYQPYAVGLALGTERKSKRDIHLFFCMMGRITGRFADREWWTSTRTFYRIPRGSRRHPAGRSQDPLHGSAGEARPA
ncbi:MULTISPECIES: hypothetical protein [Streptosporangium]|uniref:Uncharacterized protein n=1 Tax=Streptosporangium brasiliense TaxID=47480 RepID=A0ABT9RJ42_9ACTN|nr:hypothetical protein [Streptosporangium brasiliense]MDP9869319.1 hypothetical protein [Streptosporangium brasiliense]